MSRFQLDYNCGLNAYIVSDVRDFYCVAIPHGPDCNTAVTAIALARRYFMRRGFIEAIRKVQRESA